MIDTAGKGGGGLLHHIDPLQLERFVSDCRKLGLLCGLAGSLRLEDIPLLLPLAPDYLGFRGALCEGNQRTQGLSRRKLEEIRAAISLTPALRADDPMMQEAGS